MAEGAQVDVTAAASAEAPVVLLVEDEPVVREITGQVLERAGYRVLESSGPSEALQMASRNEVKVDVLLTDVIMPGMNGIDLAQRLLTLQPGVVTVFMSGYAEGDLLRSMNAASALHIQKPFTVGFLLSRMKEALHARSAKVKTA